MKSNIEIKPGDTVTICSQGTTRTGIVTSAANYGSLPWSPEPCWYIELDDPIHGSVYWKQDLDSGSVEYAK